MQTWTLGQIQDSFYSTHPGKLLDKGHDEDEDEEDETDNLFFRWEDFWKRKIHPNEHFPSPSATYEALEQYLASHPRNAERGASQANWTFAGPSKAYASQGTGKLNCIAFHPTDTSIIWVGSEAGGLWKTTNGGNSWVHSSGNMVNSGIQEIVIDPINANIMYLITAGSWGALTRNIGVFKSTDGGNTWNTTGLTYPATAYAYFHRIAMHPVDHNILFVAASNGIWKTINGGTTWTQQVSSREFHEVKFNPSNPAIVYATTHIDVNGFYAEIYRSTNTGATWSLIKTIANGGRTFLAVTPANPALVMSITHTTGGAHVRDVQISGQRSNL